MNLRKVVYAVAAAFALFSCKHSEPSGEASAMAAADAGMSMMEADAGMHGGMAMSDAGGIAYGSAQNSMSGTAAGVGATTAADAAARSATPGSAAGSAGSSAAATTPATSTVTLSDGQIAGITAAAHQSEIDAARVARKISKNAKVRSFAAKMIKDHTAALKAETALAQTAGIAPSDSDISAKIKTMSADSLANLKTLKGNDFDKTYAQGQVDAHQQVLDTIDNDLLPQVQNAALKEQLTKERPVVASHLEMAKQLVSDLSLM
jgi:putative membrane protein